VALCVNLDCVARLLRFFSITVGSFMATLNAVRDWMVWASAALFAVGLACAQPAQPAPRSNLQASLSTVYFPGSGGVELVGYVHKPKGRGPFAAVVMLHGRGGPYSSNVNAACGFVRQGEVSVCNVTTLTQRSKMWGSFWSDRGVLAIHVDSFGPRGVGHGFASGTHGAAERDAVNELTVRPLDAEAAKAYLLTRADVRPAHIALQGWSNGASTALNVMFNQLSRPAGVPDFARALVFYPGCGSAALLSNKAYSAGAPTTVFLAGNDEEVNPETCRTALTNAPVTVRGSSAGAVDVTTYNGATHDFDDPGRTRQAVPANVLAKDDSMARSMQIVKVMARTP
jgi:dienelactone hydrolase